MDLTGTACLWQPGKTPQAANERPELSIVSPEVARFPEVKV